MKPRSLGLGLKISCNNCGPGKIKRKQGKSFGEWSQKVNKGSLTNCVILCKALWVKRTKK
jgi:hypothetical protein